MASQRNCPNGMRISMAILIFSLTLLPSNPVVSVFASYDKALKERKVMELGSRPPVCRNKCLSCRPCKATLVIPPHSTKRSFNFKVSSQEEDDTYYLLSWKCRCGDKIYQP